MNVNVRPEAFLVTALTGSESAGFSVENQATTLLVTQTQIPLEKFQSVSLLRPYLSLILKGGSEKALIVVRFRTFRENRVIHSLVMEHRYFERVVFNPEIQAEDGSVLVADIKPHRRSMVGNWRVTAEVNVLPYSLLSHLGPDSTRPWLEAQSFHEMAAWGFEIVESAPGIALTATGRMVEDRRDTGRTFSINDY